MLRRDDIAGVITPVLPIQPALRAGDVRTAERADDIQRKGIAMSTASTTGPHSALDLRTPQERFLARLFDALWATYRQRVSYVQTYEKVVAAAGARFHNDHIAFRTIAAQAPQEGIASVARIFEALGYRAAGAYYFDDKHLSALHFQHAHAQFPKLFISELQTWKLSAPVRDEIAAAVRKHRPAIDLATLARLAKLDEHDALHESLLQELVKHIEDLPWPLVERETIERVNRESQYAAWVLVHGYNVNHFTSLINSHGVAALDDIEKTIAALTAAGVPMKKEIEGERGSKLRQTATEAVNIEVDVAVSGQPAKMPWTYAYFELAQRDPMLDPATGQQQRFEGFLGPQATNLFEMTRVK
jgi:hypothetical protein